LTFGRGLENVLREAIIAGALRGGPRTGLATLRSLTLHDAFAVDLSQPGVDIHVAKVLVPGAQRPRWI